MHPPEAPRRPEEKAHRDTTMAGDVGQTDCVSSMCSGSIDRHDEGANRGDAEHEQTDDQLEGWARSRRLDAGTGNDAVGCAGPLARRAGGRHAAGGLGSDAARGVAPPGERGRGA